MFCRFVANDRLNIGFPSVVTRSSSHSGGDEENGPLTLGFPTDPAISVFDSPEVPSIAALIHRGATDLREAMRRLEIDGDGQPLSVEEVLTRRRVVDYIEGLLFACSLISIPGVSR